MAPRFLLLGLALLAAPASAAGRSYIVTNFDRIRVDGPFEVRLTVGPATSGNADGDPRALDDVSLDVQGTTLIVRRNANGWGEQGSGKDEGPIVITVSAPMLRSASVIGGGKLTVGGAVRGQRIDFQVTGTGSIDAQGLDVDELNTTLVGSGNASLAGVARRARLSTNGTGTIAAQALVANDLVVRLDGPGETRANARFTADLTSTGLGHIAVDGAGRCVKHAQAGGPITCASDGKSG
jgi:hypothetical protein